MIKFAKKNSCFYILFIHTCVFLNKNVFLKATSHFFVKKYLRTKKLEYCVSSRYMDILRPVLHTLYSQKLNPLQRPAGLHIRNVSLKMIL